MPRRNYTARTRCRPVPPGDGALQYLRTERTPPCVVCGKSLPPAWPYPEHARCLNTGRESR